jgi:hypothetical protein
MKIINFEFMELEEIAVKTNFKVFVDELSSTSLVEKISWVVIALYSIAVEKGLVEQLVGLQQSREEALSK